MLALVLIFLLMTGLLSAGWQWPLLFTWRSDRVLDLMLRGSWLFSIWVPSAALADFVLRRFDYRLITLGLLLFGMATVRYLDMYRASELTAQAWLLVLWILAALERPTMMQKRVVGGFAAVHGFMFAVGAVAKLYDPGWQVDAPDVLMRFWGPWTAFLYVVPAAGVIAASWLVGRART